MTIFRGTAHDDNLSGTSGNDQFLLWQGGNDTVDAGDGNDVFRMGAAFNAGDKLNGGAGHDAIILNGDYSAGVVFNADTITNIETIALVPGHSYNLTLANGNLAGVPRLLVRGEALRAGDHFTFDGSAANDGGFYILGGAGDNTLTGNPWGDVFDLSRGGNSIVHGIGGHNLVIMTAAASVAFDSAASSDIIALKGGGTVLAGQIHLTGVEKMTLDNNTWHIAMDSTGIADGETLRVDATALTGAHTLAFDASLMTAPDASFTFVFGSNLAAGESLTGGAGDDTLELNGAVNVTLGATTLTSIDTVKIIDGHSYTIVTNDGNVAAGGIMTVDGTLLTAGHALNFDGSAETDGVFHFTGGAGDDILAGGALIDTITPGKGSNTVEGGGSADNIFCTVGSSNTFVYTAGSDSMLNDRGTGYDNIQNVDFGHDVFDIDIAGAEPINQVITIVGGDLSNLNNILRVKVAAAFQAGNGAVLLEPDSGGLADHAILVIDVNGDHQYVAGTDLVIDVTGCTGTMTVSDFFVA